MNKLILCASSILLVAAVGWAEKSEKSEKAPATERKPNAAAITTKEIARKHMELADIYAQGLNNDQQCELEVYDSGVIQNLDRAIGMDSSLKANIPASIRQAVGSRLGFKLIVESETGYNITEKTLHGVRVFVAAPTSMLSGVLDFKSDGTFVESKNVWDDASEDFKGVTNKGTWKLIASDYNKKRFFPTVSLNFARKNGKSKTIAYTIVPESGGGYYLVKAHIGKKLTWGDSPQYADSGYTSDDSSACNH